MYRKYNCYLIKMLIDNRKQSRDNSVDIAKGIGIILVLWGHTFSACPILQQICYFHMPLFFMLSGFFMKYENIWLVLYKKIRTILIPFLFFYLACVLIKECLYYHQNGIFNMQLSFFSTKQINYPLWFLICLFFSEIIYQILLYKSTLWKGHFVISMVLLSAFISYVLYIEGVTIKLWISQSLLVLPFMHIGHLYKKYINKIKKYYGLLLILMSLFFLIGIIFEVKTDIADLKISMNPILFYLPAFGGAGLTIILSDLIAEKYSSKILRQLGIYSLFIFALHANMGFLDSLLTKIVLCSYNAFSLNISSSIKSMVVYGIYKVIIELILCYFIGWLLKKIMPIFFSYSRQSKLYLLLSAKR